MYKECYSFIGEMLDKAAAGDKWGVLDSKQDAYTRCPDEYTKQQIEAAHDQATKILKEKGVVI